MIAESIAVDGIAIGLCREIAELWRARVSIKLLHVAWEHIGDGTYVGTVNGYRVTLHFWRCYETADLAGNPRLRDPARTRHALLVRCTVDAARYSPQARLSDLGVRGESMAAMERFESRRRGLDARTVRVFGFRPEWGTI